MTLHTQQSLSGSLASEPQQSITESGDTRFYVRIGQPHFRREDGGGFTELEPTFHDLVAYRATAERALAAKLRAPIGTPPAPRMSSHERPGFPGPAQPRWVCEVTVAAPWLEPAPDLEEAPFGTSPFDDFDGPLTNEPPHPVNWNSLTAEEAGVEWIELNRWVNWLRRTYGLPASVVPPFWHRHTELAWELSALHLHWLCAYDPDQHGSAPFGWHPDFADARQRLRDWVATSGTRLKRDRPTRQTSWPGEPPAAAVEDVVIANREEDFVQFVVYDVARRRVAEGEFHANAKFS